MNINQLSDLLQAQQKIIEQIALGIPLPECLKTICQLIESIIGTPEAKSSILVLKGHQLWHGAAPSLPSAYCQSIDGMTIGNNAGSCGTSAFTDKQVIVSDIEHDLLWQDFKDIALKHGLKACWSTPIFSSRKEILGSFAIYYTEVKSPHKVHLSLIDYFTHLSGLAIERHQTSDRESDLLVSLKNTNEKIRAITSAMPDQIIVVDEKGCYVDFYGDSPQLPAKNPEGLIGQVATRGMSPEQTQSFMALIKHVLKTDEVQVCEYEMEVAKGKRCFEGRFVRVKHYLHESPDRQHILWVARDITDKKKADLRIEQLAFYDPLTDQPNRRLMTDRLQGTIDKVKRHQTIGALLFLDLDDFKRINDSLGHNVGDQLLVKVTQRLKPLLRDTDTFSRIGGDEFVIILESMEKDKNLIMDQATSVSKKLLTNLSHTFHLGNGDYRIGGSIGIKLIEDVNETTDDILKHADAAMYRAKKMGRNCYAFYEPALQELIDKRLEVESEISTAITQRHFCAFFQPQIDMQGGLIGAEALIRWRHPKKGLISPAHFIPVAEQSGHIHHLQQAVLDDSCQLILQLKEASLIDEGFSIAINISAGQFDFTLENSLVSTLDTYQLSPRHFKLEITESMLMDNIDNTVNLMHRLRDLGFRFSVDDFGTGYSSLAYLHNFPIDELKIDGSFVQQLTPGGDDTAIIDAIIAIAKQLELRVIAEGVEDDYQVNQLSLRQVDAMQGYFFARPMPASEMITWVRKSRESYVLNYDI
ncbi:sensor domain-containing phosphodiesterase [Hahella ganghwensis]|uniref:sensor domain-containing phosphodiesterase n=1 Tax=Hahella ganghwensis TaxID=286420 RepID=UPI000361F008|nr:EAL domain-containing protein [Hahella ganghwensis]